MNKDSLVERRDAVERNFTALQTKREEINLEMTMLQGEFRLLTQQITQLDDMDSKAIEVKQESKKRG